MQDVEAIVDMGIEFWKHSVFNVPAERESIEAMAEHCINNNMLAVLEIEDQVEGFVAGITGPLLGNHNYTCVTEVAWWVNENHRGGRNGILLMDWLEKQAFNQGINFLGMAYMETSMPESIRKIYEKRGLIQSEALFLKRLQ